MQSNPQKKCLSKVLRKMELMMLLGTTMDAQKAYEVSRCLPHLHLRIQAHSERALMFAQRAEELDGVRVRYPGLESHPQHELATQMMNLGFGYGGMIAMDFGNPEKAQAFAKRLQDLGGGFNAVSLGFSETLVSVSSVSTSSEIEPEHQEEMGLSDGLVRASIGYIGDPEVEWSKMEQAIHHATAAYNSILVFYLFGREDAYSVRAEIYSGWTG